jgi:hypothetical protein
MLFALYDLDGILLKEPAEAIDPKRREAVEGT